MKKLHFILLAVFSALLAFSGGMLLADGKILLVVGNDRYHNCLESAPLLQSALENAGMDVTRVDDFNVLADPKIMDFQAIILHFKNDRENPPADTEALEKNLAEYAAKGGGLVLVHFAIGALEESEAFQKIVGRVWNPKMRGHDPYRKFPVRMLGMEPRHPITAGLEDFDITDEMYTCTDGSAEIEIVAGAVSSEDRLGYPLAYIYRNGESRVFHLLLGHDSTACGNPGFSALLVRGTQFAAGMLADSEDFSRRNAESWEILKNLPEQKSGTVETPPTDPLEENRLKALQENAPAGATLVGYMNCGTYFTSSFGTMKIVMPDDLKTFDFLQQAGKTHSKTGVSVEDVSENPRIDTTVFYTEQLMEFWLEGVDRAKKYQMNIRWWDFDAGMRAQGIYLASPDGRLIRRSLDPVALPNFTIQGKGPATRSVLLPSAFSKDGKLRVRIPFSNPNCVVSEIWIYELEN